MRWVSAKTMMLAGLLNMALLSPTALAARFTDIAGNWAERYVNKLSDDGVIAASSDGKFHPDEPVTRAVLSAWLVKSLGLENQPVPDKPSFSDVKKSDWYYKPIEIVRQNNYIAGYEDGFRPNQFIQKGEVIVIIARTLPTPVPDEEQISQELAKFKDGDLVPAWARAGIAQAMKVNIVTLKAKTNRLESTSLATRADTAALLYQLSNYYTHDQIQRATKDASTNSLPESQSPVMGEMQDNQPLAESSSGSQQSAITKGAEPLDQFGTAQPSGAGERAQNQKQAYATPPAGYPTPPSDYQGFVSKQGSGLSSAYLQGNVSVVDAGTHFRAALNNTLDSSYNKPGEEFLATVSEPVYSGGMEVIPVGSKLIGQITNVVSAKYFHFSANGRIDVKFIAVETPDGRRYPLLASIDAKQLKAAAGVTGGAVSNTLKTTGRGVKTGAKYGGTIGGIIGLATSKTPGVGPTIGHGLKGAATGAIVGSALGGATGLVKGGVQKGQDITVPAGTTLPIQLDQPLQLSSRQSGGTVSTGSAPVGYPTPIHQPYGDFGQPPGGYVPMQQQYNSSPPQQAPYAGYPQPYPQYPSTYPQR